VRGQTRASEGEDGRLASGGRATPARHADDRRLRTSEARYQALVAATAQIVWTTSPDGVVDDMPAWRAYTGQSVEEVRSWGWLDALHPEDRARAARLWAEAVAARSACEVECRVRRHDGAYRSFLVRGVPVLDDDGGSREWVGIGTDVTARKQAEAALRASEELRRTVVANAPIVLFAVDRDGIFTLSEGRGLEALGIEPDEHVGQSYFALYSHLPDSVAALRRTLGGEAATTVERYKGLIFETQWMPTRDAEGTVTGAIGVSSNITERARADEERRRLERRTRAAVEALLAMAQALAQVPDDTADDASVESVARQLGALTHDVLGCRSVSVIGLTPPDHLRPLVCVGLSAEHEEVWCERITRWPRDTDLFRALSTRLRAGETVLIDTTQPEYQAMANPFGIERYLLAPMRVGAALVGVLAIDGGPAVLDPDHVALVEAVAQLAGLVLERERLQREREEARSNALALREANRRMDEFLGIAGHEMRTPLTSSIGYTQLVQLRLGRLRARHDLLPAAARALGEVHHLLDRSNAALERLSILVNDLLDVSRIQAGLLQVRPQPCNLAEVVRAVIDEQRELAPSRTIRLDLPAVPVPVRADAVRIGQVVTNYLSNALKYSAEDQPVSVGLDNVGTQARVWVRDEGPGVAPEERARIWERFYRAERVEHRSGSSVGLGLGLHISRTIIIQHGGEVGVESEPGVGATFWFALPLDETRWSVGSDR
jgi:PAS domain S-box-containing protein